MLAVTAVLAVVVVATGTLGTWQLDRARANGQRSADARVAAQRAAEPRDLLDVLAPQQGFDGAAVGVKVQVTGHWDVDDQVLVTGRAKADAPGDLVLTGLRVPGAGDAVLPVVRGWLADSGAGSGGGAAADGSGVDDGTGGGAAASALADPPAGEVTVIGYLQPAESADGAIPVDGRVTSISPAGLLQEWDGPIWSGYLVLESVDPVDPATPLPELPGATSSADNLRNLAYAAQWWIFGAFAVLVWWRFLRDQLGDDAVADPESQPAAASHHGSTSTR